jgi:hypothetical protein
MSRGDTRSPKTLELPSYPRSGRNRARWFEAIDPILPARRCA